jgi:TonB family protein
VSDPEGEGRGLFEGEHSTLASMGSRRLWFFRARAPRADEPASSKNGGAPSLAHSMLGDLASLAGDEAVAVEPASSKDDDAPSLAHSMLGDLASLAGDEPEPESDEPRSSLLDLGRPQANSASAGEDAEDSKAPLTAHSMLDQLAGLEEHSSFAFPIERAILISLAAHILFVILMLVAPGRTAVPEGNLIDTLAAAMQTPKDDSPIPAFFSEAPGAPRPNPNRAPLSDADRRAGGGDPQRPKAERPFIPRDRGIEGLAPGPRAPRIAGASPAAPRSAAEKGAEAAGAENRAALERPDPSQSKPSEFPSDMRPQLGSGPKEVTKLAGLDAAIRDAARGTVGRPGSPGAAGEEGAPLSNEDGGFVDMGGVSFETNWYDWGPYAAEMLRRIKLHWKISRDLLILQQHGTVRISFSIMADGSVADVKVLRPSTIPPYTHAAAQAIVESNPFRPLPRDLLRLMPGKDRERIVIHFIYFPTPEELDGRRDGGDGK